MAICIYCRLDEEGGATFSSVEHVFPDAFGGFENALTLVDTVCDDCNAFFSKTVDMYLARDTPIGLLRFLLGRKPTTEYKHLGRRSQIRHRVEEGRLAGATVVIEPGESDLITKPLPQVGFGRSQDGPFRWYELAALPPRDELRAVVEGGERCVEFLEVTDVDSCMALLASLGISQQGELVRTGEPGQRGRHYFESTSLLMAMFGRALAKIGLNYLAHQLGPSTARMPAFNAIRDYVRQDMPLPLGTWWSVRAMPASGARAHVVALHSDEDTKRVFTDISFFGRYRYRIVLCSAGMLVTFPPQAHRWDLDRMVVEELGRADTATWT